MVDKNAIRRYHKRVDARLAARGAVREDYNDKHDRLGRFAKKSGGPSGKSAEDMTRDDVKVKSPKESRVWAESYLKSHPEAEKKIRRDAKRFSDAMRRVREFEKDNPGAEDGSYDILTGEREDVNSGYCVTFHQNLDIGDEFGGYDSETYALMAAISKHELGADKVYIGYFGNPEISFNCPSYQKAKEFAVEHNQYSIWDAKRHVEWVNDLWDEGGNPIRGRGSN